MPQDNKTFGFQPTDRQRDLITRYQRENGTPENPLKKSDAIRDVVDVGLDEIYGGFTQGFFLELTKMGVWIGLTLALMWWWSGIGLQPVAFYLDTLTYIFLAMAAVSLIIHLSNFNPLSRFSGTDAAEGTKARS